MRKLTASEELALREVAAEIGCPAVWLAAEIEFESGWDPLKPHPKSSGRGLIQFMKRTAKALGYEDSEDLIAKHPTVEEQLRGPVLRYLKPWGPFLSIQELAFAVFLPSYRRADPETVLPEWVQESNPGIVRVRDYTAFVESRIPAAEAALGEGT